MGSKRAASIAEVISAQRTVGITMRDKSGNVWEFDLSPVCARTVDAQDRLYPLPIPRQRIDKDGRGVTDEHGSPVLDTDDDEFRAKWIAATKARAKAAVAAAMPDVFFGADLPSFGMRVKALEDLFAYDELHRIANLVMADAIATKADAEEAHADVAPFASTAVSGSEG